MEISVVKNLGMNEIYSELQSKLSLSTHESNKSIAISINGFGGVDCGELLFVDDTLSSREEVQATLRVIERIQSMILEYHNWDKVCETYLNHICRDINISYNITLNTIVSQYVFQATTGSMDIINFDNIEQFEQTRNYYVATAQEIGRHILKYIDDNGIDIDPESRVIFFTHNK